MHLVVLAFLTCFFCWEGRSVNTLDAYLCVLVAEQNTKAEFIFVAVVCRSMLHFALANQREKRADGVQRL